MLDSMNLDVTVSQVEENVGLTNMSYLENLNFVVSEVQENTGLTNISDPKNFPSKY